jgi:hypothetical protein
MWHDMFVEQIPLAEKVIRTIVVYAVLMVLFGLPGKRGLAAMNTFDFIVIFLLSNVVQNAVIGNDNSLLGGMVGAVTLVAVTTARPCGQFLNLVLAVLGKDLGTERGEFGANNRDVAKRAGRRNAVDLNI